MPSRLSTPVLTVDPAKIHQVDTRNAESLHGMWMVFSRCADFMEEGRRLENLSWRLWNRETFCVAPQAKSRTNSDNNSGSSNSKDSLQQKRTHSGSRLERLRRESKSIPDLSSSVESALSDEGLEQSRSRSTAQTSSGSSPQCPCTPRTIELDPKPAIVGEDSVLSISRGRERHITSLGLEKMVYSIKEKKQLEPICVPKSKSQLQIENRELDATPRASSPTPVSTQQQPKQQQQQQEQQQHQEQTHLQQHPAPANNQSLDSCSTALERVRESDVPTPSSDTSVSSAELPRPASSVVRGFSPSKISSFRSHGQLSPATSTSKNSVPKQSPLRQQKPSVFTLGCSSGDEESSFEDRMAIKTHRSSLSDGLNHLASAQHSRSRTSFIRDTAATSHPIRPIRETSASDEDAIASSDEDDESEISESAIEDEDEGDSSDGDWEDSVTESGRSSVDDKQLFQRVDSRPNLVSRRSLLTMMMHQPQQNFAPTFRGGPGPNSRSTPAMQQQQQQQQQRGLPPTDGEEEDNDEDHSGSDSGSVGSPGLEMKRSEVPHSRPIVMTSIPPGGIVARAHSPRTTRRNMLATELTESLRRHLLWERQQKTTAATATAAFKRRHTACDVAGLQEYPGANDSKGQGKEDKESKNSSWNHYFDYGPWEYHVKGW